jgi:hypothetical protein
LNFFLTTFGQVATLGTFAAGFLLTLKTLLQDMNLNVLYVPLIFLGASTGLSLFGMAYVVVTLHPDDRRIGQYFYKLLPLMLFASIICLALGLIILGYRLFDLA